MLANVSPGPQRHDAVIAFRVGRGPVVVARSSRPNSAMKHKASLGPARSTDSQGQLTQFKSGTRPGLC